MLTLVNQILRSEPLDQTRQRTDILIVIAGSIGLFIHLCILVLFFRLGVWSLFQVNIISCLVWALIIYLGSQGRSSPAIHIGTAEVIVHSLATTLVLGPEYGFHYYLWPISILIAINPSLDFRISGLIASSTILLFACLNTVTAEGNPLQLSATTLLILYAGNIVISGLAMILTGTIVKTIFSQQQSVLKELAQTDELTRVYNRRYALKFLGNTEANRRRNQLPYSVCICDLDNFKQINDNYGHGSGDEVLQKFARFLQSSVRETDCVARWGGEEFLVILTHTEGVAAESTMNHLLEKLRTIEKITTGDGRLLSASIGIAEAGGDGEVDATILLADKALYQAKAEGRDRVVYLAAQ